MINGKNIFFLIGIDKNFTAVGENSQFARTNKNISCIDKLASINQLIFYVLCILFTFNLLTGGLSFT